MFSGRMEVVAIDAALTRDCEWFTKMSPFLEVTIGQFSQQTDHHRRGGMTPDWKRESLMFQINNECEIKFTVWDHEPNGKHDHVGSGSIMNKNIAEGANQYKLPIHYEGKEAGRVKIGCVWEK